MTFAAGLDVAGREVAVVGGSAEALGSISALINAGARVTVISPDVATSIRDLAQRRLLTWLPRTAAPGDFLPAALVVPATGQRHADEEVRRAATRENRISITAAEVAAAPVTQAQPADSLPDPVATPAAEQTGQAGSSQGVGRVVLVGGGPGDPGLLTVAGLEAIRTADVLVCDRLAPLAALKQARPGSVVVDVGKIPRGEFTPQEQINAVLVEHARQGRTVVRLKGGDSFIFGRGGEEWQACAAAGIPVEVIPGVSSAVAAPALAGIPLTHRQLTQGFTVVSGHLPPGHPGSTLDWGALARTNTTLVVMMGVATLGAIADELVCEGLPPGTPAATVADAGMASQRSVRGTLGTIARLTSDAGLGAPAITVIGAVAGFDPGARTP
jgi:uroporphyrin-III C-methyltransferase